MAERLNLLKILGRPNARDRNAAEASSKTPRRDGWNILHYSSTITSLDLDRFDRFGGAPRPTVPLALVPAVPTRSSRLAPSEPSEPLRECLICCETDVQFSLAPPTDQCLHQPDACEACLAKMIKVAISSKSDCSNIRCPSLECGLVLEYEDVRHVLGKDRHTFDRYNDMLFQEYQQAENYVVCINPTCGAGQIHSGENFFPVVTCHRCGLNSCYTHRVEWHEGYTCKEWDQRQESRAREELMSQEWIFTETKRCPRRECNRPIKKDEGCDHMTCRRPGGCGHEFCWVCLAPYGPIRESGNHNHRPTCAYYSAPRPPPVPLHINMPPTPISQTRGTRGRWQVWRNNEPHQPATA